MKWTILPGVLMWMLVLAGCGNGPGEWTPPAPAALERLGVEERVWHATLVELRRRMDEQAEAPPGAFYVAVAGVPNNFVSGDVQRSLYEPSDNLQASLSTFSRPVKRISQCVMSHRDRLRCRDKITGELGIVVWVGPIRWLGPERGEFEAGWWENDYRNVSAVYQGVRGGSPTTRP